MNYVHTVYFTFAPGTTDADIDAQIADGHELLARIPTVRSIHTGRRDATMQRDVSMIDFDLGLSVLFDDRAGHDVYADHPIHLDYIARNRDKWTAVRVADFEAE
jgi:hypothetical protein